MSSLADQVIAALRSGHDELSAAVAKLDEAGLAGPSGASEWDVAGVLSHLGSGAEIGLATLERALAGGGPAPDGFNQSVWDRWNAMARTERRDGFIDADRRLVERYENLDAVTREDLRIDLGWLPAPVSVARAGQSRLLELTLHGWDARIGVDPTATLAPEAVPLVFEAVESLLGWIAKPAQLDGRHADLAVDLSEPERSFGLLIGDSVTVGERPGQPDGVLVAPAEAWLRLLAGRLAVARTPAAVEVRGPLTLDDLRRLFPGY